MSAWLVLCVVDEVLRNAFKPRIQLDTALGDTGPKITLKTPAYTGLGWEGLNFCQTSAQRLDPCFPRSVTTRTR